MYQLLALLGGFGLLTLLAMRGHSIFVVAPLCAGLVLAVSGADPVAGLTGPFMAGFSGFLRDFYLIFALGAAFGRLMEKSGAAAAVARGVVQTLGSRWACLAVVLSCAVLTYGGVSLFVVGFSVYPLAVELFREANLPRRFIPASIAFGSVTFTMTTAGSPEIQNLIPIGYLIDNSTGQSLTHAAAGWPASLLVSAVMFGLGQAYLERAIRRDLARGLRFEPRAADPTAPAANEDAAVPTQLPRGPGLAAALSPLLVTLLTLNLLPPLAGSLLRSLPEEPTAATWQAATASLLAHFPADKDMATAAVFFGVLTAVIALRRHLRSVWQPIGDGFVNGLIAIGSTCSVVGFGAAVQKLPAFQGVVNWVTNLPVDPLLGAALAVAVIAGLAGSASGGQGLAWPIIKSVYVDELGVAPRALHRVVAIASGSLDTLPANGYLLMLIRNICGESHKTAYGPICVTCTLIPLLGTFLAIALFKLFPAWGLM